MLVSVAGFKREAQIKRRQYGDINLVRHAFFRIPSLSSVGNNVKGRNWRGFGTYISDSFICTFKILFAHTS